jgi:hypothetical protein
MNSSGLFTDAINAVDPQRVLRTETRPHLLQRQLGVARPPTNQEILDAAKATYGRFSRLVDLNTTSGFSYVKSSPGHRNVAALNAYDWKSQNAQPIAPTAHGVFASDTMAQAVGMARDTESVVSLAYGITESAQIIVGEEGGIGIAFALDRSGNLKGTAFVAGKLGLDIDVAVNLQIGIWAASPQGLAGDFVGLEVNLDLDVGVSLGIYLHPKDLSFYGFAVGIGVGVGGGATIVGGYTWVF